jgi:hypothetical protein
MLGHPDRDGARPLPRRASFALLVLTTSSHDCFTALRSRRSNRKSAFTFSSARHGPQLTPTASDTYEPWVFRNLRLEISSARPTASAIEPLVPRQLCCSPRHRSTHSRPDQKLTRAPLQLRTASPETHKPIPFWKEHTTKATMGLTPQRFPPPDGARAGCCAQTSSTIGGAPGGRRAGHRKVARSAS